MATVERFNEEQFYEALLDAVGGDASCLHRVGFIGGELRYAYRLREFSNNVKIYIQVNSSISVETGLAADTGNNSIRGWLTDNCQEPLGSKTQRWVTREPGWQNRLSKLMDDLINLGKAIEYCPTCGTLEKIFKVKKEGNNKGRLFKKCACGKFMWMDDYDPDLPSCPKCGGAMVKRNGRRGEFWGCTRFPSCKGTRDVDDIETEVYINEEPEEEPERVASGRIGDPIDKITTVVEQADTLAQDTKQALRDLKSGKTKKQKFQPSVYQQAIYDWLLENLKQIKEQGYGKHLVVRAMAGSGKTTTGIKMLGYTAGLDVLFVAFNKAIQVELAKRAPTHVKVKTFHALGFEACRQAFDITLDAVDDRKIFNIFREVVDYEMHKHLYSPVNQLVSLVKANLLGTTDEELADLAYYYNIDMNGDVNFIFQIVRKVMEKSVAMTKIIDFDDMCYLPVYYNLPLHQFDIVFIDECLPYKTPVHLADGSYKEIGDIVDNTLPVEVLAYNDKTGKQEVCKVVNWYKIPNMKRLVKIRAKWDKIPGRGWTHSFVVCTEDHKVWTTNGWVAAGKLNPGDRIQVETSAYKSSNYKISTSGKKTLSKVMTEKNANGIGGTPSSFTGKQGGNGRKMPHEQQLLIDALGNGWETEYVVKTKHIGGVQAGYPWHYKIDIADPVRKIAVEIDGNSHRGRKEQDDRKDNCLEQLGWTVYRFSNEYVFFNLQEVVEQLRSDCPILATVVSVEDTYIKDYYVYDISVEKCHNFYANSILVHNCQDTNKNQTALVMKAIKPTGTVIAVGDDYQSMYGFRGANVDAIPNLIGSLDAEELPLSITYRCPQSHVRLVNKKFPEIPLEAWEEKGEGEILYWNEYQALGNWKAGDMVLCRTNAPLVKPCFALIRKGVKATIRGRDIGKGLIDLVKKMNAVDIVDMMSKLSEYLYRETQKLMAARKEAQAASLTDKVNTVIALADGLNSTYELENRILSVFSDKVEGVVFSTIHKAKGLEADHVSILEPDLMPHPAASRDWELQQERNIEYVALTRSKQTLVFVV